MIFSPDLPLGEGRYFAKSYSNRHLDVLAVDHAYIDLKGGNGTRVAGEMLFSLNTAELDREDRKIERQQAFLRFSEIRLSKSYVKRFVLGPLDAMVDLAIKDRDATRTLAQYVADQVAVGEANQYDLAKATAAAQDKYAVLAKAKAELNQRTREVSAQRRSLDAERKNLSETVELNAMIRELHTCTIAWTANVEFFVYSGAFVERGDLICSIYR